VTDVKMKSDHCDNTTSNSNSNPSR
jgi:hypothetical protein